MIITKQKPIEEILGYLEDCKKIFIVGCAQCATVCKTGGEEEVKKMKQILEEHGKQIVGFEVWNPPCNLLEIKKKAREKGDLLLESEAILSMSCGDGTYAISQGTNKKVYPSTNTLFLGESERAGHFSEACSLCGECTLFMTGGFCPNTLCPKGLQNGPCGGAKEGKCEISPDLDCGWISIYKRLKELGELHKMKHIQPPKDHSKSVKPRKIILSNAAKCRI
ncbi:MAG: methylenetetrahydrofolate reductase C-terminal domain-containing protein [Candidatus Omnitrophota bacterium]